MEELISQLIEEGCLKSKPVIRSLLSIDRKEFISSEFYRRAGENIVIPIGHNQTNSEPYVVAFMLELLDIKPGQKILDVGSGSGWTTGLISHMVGKAGQVFALEIIKELKELGERNVDKFGFVKNGIATFYQGDGHRGLENHMPFDRILVSAQADSLPEALLNQLKIGGKMVIPINRSLWFIEKRDANYFFKKEYKGFYFVPFVKQD